MENRSAKEAGEFYEKAAEARSAAAPDCCGPARPALAVDYDPAALNALPREAVAASFGCGDPLAFAHVKPGQSVLDLGCGAGLDLLIAAKKVGETGAVIGVDVSADMLRRAKTNAERAGLSAHIDLRQGEIEHLPVDDASIDWIVSNCVVNLSPDKAKVFAEIYRVLKPGGKALIADLVAEDLPQWVLAHADLYSACVSGAVSERTYLEFAENAGLKQAWIVDRLQYDSSMVRGLLEDALPIAVDAISDRLGMDRAAFLDMASTQLAGRISSIKLHIEKPQTIACCAPSADT
jgi:SAM-dependent methyltransferase